jgi:hypothetical protein
LGLVAHQVQDKETTVVTQYLAQSLPQVVAEAELIAETTETTEVQVVVDLLLVEQQVGLEIRHL